MVAVETQTDGEGKEARLSCRCWRTMPDGCTFQHAGILVASENMFALLFRFYSSVIWKFNCSCRLQAFVRRLKLV